MESQKIVIVGGGTAGWMTANILAFSLQDHNVDITVIESPDIGTVGVGEGSTPALKVFFDKLGISELEWMPACNATYKCGITFKDWSTKPDFEQYYHPFASRIDSETMSQFKKNVRARVQGLDVVTQPEFFFISAYLAKNHLAPIPHHSFPFDVSYGYHFESELLGKFLREKAKQRGVTHILGTVTAVTQSSDGSIEEVKTKEGQTYKGSLFIDCTGFRSLLSQKTLETPFMSYGDQLFNDAAIAMPSEMSGPTPSETVSTALKNGWAWQIPLKHRFGNGYVYSSRHCTKDEAETELRQQLGLLGSDIEARHLKMKVGRVEKSWNKNVLAVGLSQGFIEPLEATALILIQQTVSLFAYHYLNGQFTEANQPAFNQAINDQFDGTKDYIHAHYLTNTRTDSEYWNDCRKNQVVSNPLASVVNCWFTGGDVAQELKQQNMERFYPVSSWYCLLAGMGGFPSPAQLKSPSDKRAYSMAPVEDFLSRCTLNFDDHKAVLIDLQNKSG